MIETDEFGLKPYQRRPRGGYWLPKELLDWPEMNAISLAATGAFFRLGVWGYTQKCAVAPRRWACHRVPKGVVTELADAGLWIVDAKSIRVTSMAELRYDRGERGLIMRVSWRMSDGAASLKAGDEALGLWMRAAVWSLNTDRPGFIPTTAALQLGTKKAVGVLFDVGLWGVREYGFYQHQGDHPAEALWELARDDERATVPAKLRRRIYARDQGRCVECAAVEDLSLDHIIPWSRGGPDTYENLRVLCRSCNSSKGARV